jgi:ribosomal protein S18 acetylase RimI-like enzyme
MNEAEYEAFMTSAIPGYAEANVGAGYWREEEALERSRLAYEALLPQGLETAGNHMFVARDAESGEPVGAIWFAIRPNAGGDQAFIYDVSVDEALRGQGYGRAVMEACVERAREIGTATVGLHVFAQNKAACRLYASLGFETTSQVMALTL